MTNVEDLKNRAQVSDLMDGRLRGRAFAHAADLVGANPEARAVWHTNHVVGDVLRFGDAAGAAADVQFVDRFRARLAQMPVTGQLTGEVSGGAMVANYGLDRQRPSSANDSNFRWKILAGFASLAAVAAIGWGALGNGGVNGGVSGPAAGAGGQLAQSGSAATGAAESQVMIRDPHLDALLAAHKQFGGTSALQMPAGFLRNATFESPSR